MTNTLGGLIGLIGYDVTSRRVGQESLDTFIGNSGLNSLGLFPLVSHRFGGAPWSPVSQAHMIGLPDRPDWAASTLFLQDSQPWAAADRPRLSRSSPSSRSSLLMLGQPCDNDSELNNVDDPIQLTTLPTKFLLHASEQSQPPTWFGSERPAFSGADR